MSISPVSGNTHVATQQPAVTPHPQASATANQSAVPQDTVTLSTAAKGQPTAHSGDVDHDADSK